MAEKCYKTLSMISERLVILVYFVEFFWDILWYKDRFLLVFVFESILNKQIENSRKMDHTAGAKTGAPQL